MSKCLFRTHVGGGAENGADIGEVLQVRGAWNQCFVRACGCTFVSLASGWRLPAGQAEVQNLGAAILRDHDVFRLQVAVDHAGGVGGGETVGDLRAISNQLANRHRFAVSSERSDSPSTSSLTMYCWASIPKS